MRLIMIRHGSTPGNALRRYIGRTDEELSEEGKEEVVRLREALDDWFAGPSWRLRALSREGGTSGSTTAEGTAREGGATAVFVSPMKRTRQTARILFGEEGASRWREDERLRECDFGLFENRNYLELEGEPAYRRWVDSGGKAPFPGGEDPEAFEKRCCLAFEELWQEAAGQGIGTVAIVSHGGTVMSIAHRFALDESGGTRDYFDWNIGNAQAYVFETVSGITAEGAGDDHFLRRTGCIGH